MTQSLKIFVPNEILSVQWFQQHALIEKLNMQAHASAKSGHDEFVVESISRESKAIVLLQNLLLIDFVKVRLCPRLLKAFADSPTSLRANAFVTNESVILNFLQVLCFHASTIQDFNESLGEFID